MMTNINPIQTINKRFVDFSRSTIKTHKLNTKQVISHLKEYEQDYRNSGYIGVFLYNAYQFADDCYRNGLKKYAGVILSTLIKNKELPDSVKEPIILQAIKVANEQKDLLGELARVVDLKKHYKNNPEVSVNKKLRVCIKEEALLKKIINNIDDMPQNNTPAFEKYEPIDVYKYKLALVMVDIAKAQIKSHKTVTMKRLLHARKIFNELNKTNEEKFAQSLINRLDYYC
jgi:hypothetical protein